MCLWHVFVSRASDNKCVFDVHTCIHIYIYVYISMFYESLALKVVFHWFSIRNATKYDRNVMKSCWNITKSCNILRTNWPAIVRSPVQTISNAAKSYRNFMKSDRHVAESCRNIAKSFATLPNALKSYNPLAMTVQFRSTPKQLEVKYVLNYL